MGGAIKRGLLKFQSTLVDLFAALKPSRENSPGTDTESMEHVANILTQCCGRAGGPYSVMTAPPSAISSSMTPSSSVPPPMTLPSKKPSGSKSKSR